MQEENFRKGVNMKKRGFTLVELMIVITVIAILTTIAVVSFTRVQKQSRDTKRKGDERSLATALQAYFTEFNSYPATLASLTPTYIPMVPAAPNGDLLVGSYSYSQSGSTNMFSLCVGQEAIAGANSYWNVTTQNTGGFLTSSCVAPQ